MRDDDRKKEREDEDEPLSFWDMLTFAWIFSALFDW